MPQRRFLAADSEAGLWRTSTPVRVTAPADGGGPDSDGDGAVSSQASQSSQSDGTATNENPAAATIQYESELYCIVTHQHERDSAFWNVVAQGVSRWSDFAPVTYTIYGSPIVAEQADYVRRCMDEGAVGIGVTLADPDGMADVIAEARAAGVVVASFNSGIEDYERLGIRHHVSINEAEGGRDAGRRLLAAGVSGPALCVIHEQQNTGLEQRCDGFEEAWPDEIERLYVPGVADPQTTTDLIAARLSNTEAAQISAVLSLNAVVGGQALEARAQAGLSADDVALASFDYTPALLDAIAAGEVLFSINTLPFVQGWHIMSTLAQLRSGTRIFTQLYGEEDPARLISPYRLTIAPYVYTPDSALIWKEIFALTNAARQEAAQGQ